jgi:adenylate cyclase
MPNGNMPMPSSVFESFYNESSDIVNQLSPDGRPGSSQEDMGAFTGEDRRPSIASATTVSSSNSKSSVGRNFQKKLQGFFGEDFPGLENVKQNSDPSLPAAATANSSVIAQRARNRNNSIQNNNNLEMSRPISPASFSRPQTPHTSEVTPWEFQDVNNKVCHMFSVHHDKPRSWVTARDQGRLLPRQRHGPSVCNGKKQWTMLTNSP